MRSAAKFDRRCDIVSLASPRAVQYLSLLAAPSPRPSRSAILALTEFADFRSCATWSRPFVGLESITRFTSSATRSAASWTAIRRRSPMPHGRRGRWNHITVSSGSVPFLRPWLCSRSFGSLFRLAFWFVFLVRSSGSLFRFALSVRRYGVKHVPPYGTVAVTAGGAFVTNLAG